MEYIIIYLLLALSVSFLCSVMEAVLLSTPISFIKMKQEQGIREASLMMRLKQDIDAPISAILSLNTVAHTVGSAGVGAEATRIFGDEWFGVISAVLTILILVLSEIIPKTVGSYYWRSLAMPAAKIIRVMVVVSYPLVWLSEWLTRLIAPGKQPLSVSREEVTAMVNVGESEGVFEHSERKVVENLFKLDDIKVADIMTPRTVVITASSQMPIREFYANKFNHIYSRIPIYDSNPDFITGFVLKQNVLEQLAEDHFDMKLSDVRRPILAYNEDQSVADVWEEMLKKKEHIAQVQNEYGCFLGVVTMEDIIETLIGEEIIDETDTIVDMQAYAREKWMNQIS